MSILKDLFISEYERLHSEAEERDESINEDALAKQASTAAVDIFTGMVDAAKDRGKYERKSV